jgi:hypothetical protein
VRSRSFLVRVESPDRNRSRGSFFFTVLGELDTIATGVTRHHHIASATPPSTSPSPRPPPLSATLANAAALAADALTFVAATSSPRRRQHLRRRPRRTDADLVFHRRPRARRPLHDVRGAPAAPRALALPCPALLALALRALRNRRLLQICVCVRMCTRRPSRGSSATSRSRARTSRRDRCARRTRLCAARLRAVVRGRCVSYPHRDHTVPVCAQSTYA